MGIFPPYQRRRKAEAEQEARTTDKGHGRREHRRLCSTTLLCGYLDWPDAAQVFELERVRLLKGKATVEVVHGLSSLGRGQADAKRLLGLVRGHWGIENQLHYVRDETLGEDRCRVRKGAGAQVLAAVRNVAVHLLGRVNPKNKAAATRRLAACPQEAVALLRC
jgi:hypothetical protein